MLSILASIAAPLLGRIFGVVDQVVEDKDAANKLKAELQEGFNKLHGQIIELVGKEIEAARSVIMAEAQGESSVQRNWRPHLMYMLMGTIVFNGAVVPLLYTFTGIDVPVFEAMDAVPADMWDIIKIGLGGYIGGRSLEKIASVVAPAIGKMNGHSGK